MLVVVGGHSRNIGKTSVVAGLIRNLKDRKWTAVKITQYGNGVCTEHSQVHIEQACGCEPSGKDEIGEPGQGFALSEEYESNGTDSGRFLAAGAERSFWLRVPAGELPRAGRILRKILAQGENLIIESNSVVELTEPEVFLMVLDFSCRDFKASSLKFIGEVDAFVVVDRGIGAGAVGEGVGWEGVGWEAREGKPQFPVTPPDYATPALTGFVNSKLAAARVP